MGVSCVFIPKVTNKEGQQVNSKLAEDLILYTGNRKDGIEAYARVKTDTFEYIYGDIIDRDENEEPTFQSLYLKTSLKNIIDNSKVASEIEFQIEEGIINQEEFENTDFGKQFIITKEGTQKKVFPLNDKTIAQETQRQAFETLNRQIRAILSEKGIDVGLLDEAEAKMGINGVTDFEALKDFTNGFTQLIRIAKGEKGEKALPEEFAHLCIRMLGLDHPLVARLIKIFQTEKTQREVLSEDYEHYKELYNEDNNLLAEECAGKLVAKYLIQRKPIDSKYKSIIQRVIDTIKEFLSQFDEYIFTNAIENAEKYSKTLADKLLSNELTKDLSIKNIKKDKAKLFNATILHAETLNKKIEELIKIEQQRILLLKQNNINNKNIDNMAKTNITTLNLGIVTNRQLETIVAHVTNISKSLTTNMEVVSNFIEKKNWKNVAKSCRLLRTDVGALQEIRPLLQDMLLQAKKDSSEDGQKIVEEVKSLLTELNTAFDEFQPFYKNVASMIWQSLFAKYIDIHPEITQGESWKRFSAQIDFTKEAIEDISWFDRWLDSAAESSSEIVRIYDDIIKRHKEKARLSTINFKKRVLAFAQRAKQEGITNWLFAFNKDEQGNILGSYVTEIDEDKFNEDKRKFLNEISKKEFHSNPMINKILCNKAIANWFTERTTNGKIDLSKPKGKLYLNKQYQQLNETQKKFLNEFLSLKRELDKMLPPHAVKDNRCIMILKDNIERIKAAGGLTDVGSIIKNALKDSVIIRSDDTEFGSTNEIIDFNGELYHSVPIFYTKLLNSDNMNDLSTDIISTLIAYSAMAYNYDSMNEIVDQLEISRIFFIENSQTKVMQGDKQIVHKDRVVGEEIIIPQNELGIKSYTVARINDLFEMQIYGRLHQRGKSINILGETVSLEKLGDSFNKLTALSVYALNFLGGVSNITTGIGMMNIEAFAKNYFNPTDVMKADAYYTKHLLPFMGQINDNVRTDILYLINEKFNILQEYESEIRETNYNSLLRRLLSKSPSFLFNNAGEHWLQNRTALACLAAYKVKRKDTGAIISLLDAIGKKPINGNYIYGAELTFDNIENIDGTAFTQENISALTRKMKAINQMMHGIYNESDRAAMQKHALGRMAIMFRKWMKPAFNRRFARGMYNYDLQDTTEGYYRTTSKFMISLFSEVNKELSIAQIYEKLSNKEKRNLRRALTETLQWALVTLGLALLDFDNDNDDKWHKKFLEYQVRRLHAELGVQFPFATPNEIFRILKSPAASISTMQNIWLFLLHAIWISRWFGEENEIQTGRFKGWNRNVKDLFMIIPYLNTIESAINPEYKISFLKQDSVW